MVIFPKPIQCSFGKKVIENKVCRGKTKVLTCKISCCLNSESFFWVSLSSFLFFPEALKLHGVWISLLLSMHPTVSVRNFLCLKIWFTPAVSFASKSVQLHFTHANHKAVKTLKFDCHHDYVTVQGYLMNICNLFNFLPLDNFAWKSVHPLSNDVHREKSGGSYQLILSLFCLCLD